MSWGSPGAMRVAGAGEGCEAGGVCLAYGRTEVGVSPAGSLQGQSSVPTTPASCWRGVGCSSTPEAAPGIYLGLYSKVFKLGKERGQVRRGIESRGGEVPMAKELRGYCSPYSPALPQSTCVGLQSGHSPASGKGGSPGARKKRGHPCRASTPDPTHAVPRGAQLAFYPTTTTYGAHAMSRGQGAGEVMAQDKAVWGDAELPLDGQADTGHVGL